MPATFKSYVDHNQRKDAKNLGLIAEALKSKGFKTKEFLKNEDEPYVFIHHGMNENLDFDGIRIYKIGARYAYRIQKEEDTHPYGKAYPLDIEEMYEDYMSEDDANNEKAVNFVINTLAEGIKTFFEKSIKSQKELDSNGIIKPIDVRSNPGGMDYSSLVLNKLK